MMVRWPSSEDPEDYARARAHRVRAGTLLLANTDLLEPTFRRSVIYIVEHNDGGTLGVVLNRPSETAVYNVLPQWAKLHSETQNDVHRRPGQTRRRAVPGDAAGRHRAATGCRACVTCRAG